jgi:hypothetical protein
LLEGTDDEGAMIDVSADVDAIQIASIEEGLQHVLAAVGITGSTMTARPTVTWKLGRVDCSESIALMVSSHPEGVAI